jgi:hypothetical protein
LLDELKNSSAAQIINNGVPSPKLRIDFDDLQESQHYSGYTSFFKFKLCQIFASLELARRLEGTGVSVIISNPGPFKSALVREFSWPVGWIKNLFSAPVETAAENIMFVATSDDVRDKTGKTFVKKQEEPLIPYWEDASIRERLWSVTMSLLDERIKSMLGEEVRGKNV